MGMQVTCARCAEPHVQNDYCEDPKPYTEQELLTLYHPSKMVLAPQMRTFSSGATRDSDDGKLDFEGFFSPLALRAFAEYMHANRVQTDGNVRASDNWQKGIPLDAYMKSMWRHFFAVWSTYRDEIDTGSTKNEQVQNLCALLFNVQGMLHEILK